MREENIEKMNFKELRAEVQLLRDELAIFKRKYEDAIYNLDSDNFGKSFTVEQNNMKAQIKVTAEEISTKVSNTDLTTALVNYSTISQTAEAITTTVTAEYVNTLIGNEYVTNATMTSAIQQSADAINLSVSGTYQTIADADSDYSTLSSRISATNTRVSAIVSGDYTDDLLSGYLTGIEITPNKIKMLDNSVYSIYNSNGLRFYDSSDQIEGWAIEPSSSYGGVLNYYVNNSNCYRFGTGMIGTGYSTSDMVIKAINSQRGRFVVDVANSGYNEVKFVGLTESGNTKRIYANGQLLATQDWVLANAGGGTATAVFG